MCYPKEPCRFVSPSVLKKVWPEMHRQGYCTDEKKYLALFSEAAGFKVIGEASTNYSKRPLFDGTPERIYSFNSNSKILYIMRNPIDRAISHYWHAVKREGETRPIEKAIMTDSHYIDAGDYAFQLNPYLKLFGSNNVKAITIEQFNKNQKLELNKIFSWLEVVNLDEIKDLNKRIHVTGDIVFQMRDFGSLNDSTLKLYKEIIKPHFPRVFRIIFKLLFYKPIKPKNISTNYIREYLHHIYEPKVDTLSKLLGKEFSEWL
jgi:hypothetical protein